MWNVLRYVWRHPLNANGKLAALWRLLRWQVASRLMPGLIALPFVENTFLFATRGMTGATGNWYCGLHEVNEMAFALHLLQPEDHFVDVGANIGSYSILAAGAARARVSAVEPIAATSAHLQRNVVLNGLAARVHCYQAGLSDASETLRFSSQLDTVNHVLNLDEGLRGEDVAVMRLDDLVGDDIPTLIKIDVEGYEFKVLRGGNNTLSDRRLIAVIIETNGSSERYGVSDAMLIAAMQAHGFAPYGYDPFRRELHERAPANGNTVFVRDREAVVRRCRAARIFQLVNGEI